MSVDRITVTVGEDLGRDVRTAAEEQGLSVSAWLAAAARAQLRQQHLRAALNEWAAEAGQPDEKLVAEAAALLHHRAT